MYKNIVRTFFLYFCIQNLRTMLKMSAAIWLTIWWYYSVFCKTVIKHYIEILSEIAMNYNMIILQNVLFRDQIIISIIDIWAVIFVIFVLNNWKLCHSYSFYHHQAFSWWFKFLELQRNLLSQIKLIYKYQLHVCSFIDQLIKICFHENAYLVIYRIGTFIDCTEMFVKSTMSVTV